MFRSSFDKNLENATSHLHLEPDWPSILLICDEINQKDVMPKNAFFAIKKKMSSPNPHSALYALLVLESVVKNCGAPMHDEVFTKENCEMFSNFLEQTQHETVRQKMLELVQTWAYAFRSSDKYQSIKDTMNILKAKGHAFPELKEADAMFTADTAPNWADGKVCHRCRVEFTFTNRKHHCRNCGQVFCGQCTAKQCPLPKYGIEKDVRVCDGCFAMLQRPSSKTALRAIDSDLPAEYLNSSLAQQVQTPPRKSEQELKEEEELQLALALSQSEAEQKKQQVHSAASTAYRMQQNSPSPEAPPAPREPVVEENNPDLAKYLNRSYWEQRKVNESPIASPSAPSPMPPTPQPQQQLTTMQLLTRTTDEAQIDEFASNMRTQVEIFVNRMKSNSSRGRSISNDSSVQTLFMALTSLHSQQLSYIKEMDDKRMWYEQLQDKLVQIKDSRAALDVLRQEHVEKLRRIAEEQERQRQIQMAQKLEIMRKKKQEYLQYQRQLALQRIQEQEREMQMRQEQQKAQYRMGQFHNVVMPPHGALGVVNAHNSPSHQMNYPYGYNPNSPGPLSGGGQFNPQMMNAIPPTGSGGLLPSAPAGPTSMPGMYSSPIPNSHPGGAPYTAIHGQIPPGMMPPNNGLMTQVMTDNTGMPNSHVMAQQQTQPQQQPTAMPGQPLPQQQQQQPTAMPGQPLPQQQQQQQQQQHPQLAHVMLHQNVVQAQSPIPTAVHMPPPVIANNGVPEHAAAPAPPPPENQSAVTAPVAAIQLQNIAAAPAPPQNEPEPPAAKQPSEPATAELISFD